MQKTGDNNSPNMHTLQTSVRNFLFTISNCVIPSAAVIITNTFTTDFTFSETIYRWSISEIVKGF